MFPLQLYVDMGFNVTFGTAKLSSLNNHFMNSYSKNFAKGQTDDIRWCCLTAGMTWLCSRGETDSQHGVGEVSI